MNELLLKIKDGFATLKINPNYAQAALKALEEWLTKEEFKDYVPQIKYLVENKEWSYLLDSFYQVIPFGTGGRRGEVGIGPNRINPWTIRASAQGHAQYLIKKYGDEAKTRGIVFAYDVREFRGNKYLNAAAVNPINNLTSKDLAIAAARVYAANGIAVHIFNDTRTTPELSFAIRRLRAIAGAMFSASHNPPDHNGKKVYDEYGGQLIPPSDEELVNEVTKKVTTIKEMSYGEAMGGGLVKFLDSQLDWEYIRAASSLSLSSSRDLKIIYTPLHGCGLTSVLESLKFLNFQVMVDPSTSNPSGRFENITFNIPNPEVIQSFDTTLKFAKENKGDIILSSDPDADRIGIMVNHKNNWIFLNGNEIAAILALYVIEKKKDEQDIEKTVIKTTVTTNLIKKICEINNIKLVGDLLIGFKYIADIMNQLENSGKIKGFLFGCEESHGYLSGDYSRDKDAVTAAIWLSELSAELKQKGLTLIDYLEQIYLKYGYFRNYLTEVRLLGAAGREKIDLIQSTLRKNRPENFGNFNIINFEDCLTRIPLLSETDRSAKDMLIFYLKNTADTESIKVTIRPSGTEPKIKMYFEIGTKPNPSKDLVQIKKETEDLLTKLERAVMLTCYKLISIDFPERGFLLFWQMPLDDKLKYFEIEPEIEKLKNVSDLRERQRDLLKLLAFLGANPIEKMDAAFKSKYKISVLEYLDLLEK